MENVSLKCKAVIERYDNGFNGIILKHNGKRLLLIKDKKPLKLLDSNRGYKIDIDIYGNFNIYFDKTKSKICESCGQNRRKCTK